jgi:hypothetical protein
MAPAVATVRGFVDAVRSRTDADDRLSDLSQLRRALAGALGSAGSAVVGGSFGRAAPK